MFGSKRTKALEQELATVRSELEQIQVENFTLESAEAFDLFTMGNLASAGTYVTEKTAMSVGAVFACVRLIAGAIAGLPLPIFQTTKEGRDKVAHPYLWLLNNEPAPSWLAASFWEYILKSILLHGDGFAVIQRLGPSAEVLVPLDPRWVEPEKRNGRLVYFVFPEDGEPFGVDQDDMLHFPGLGFDGLRSLSPIKYAAKEAVGLAIATSDFSSTFFSNGARPDFALKAEGKLTDDSVRQLRETWIKRHGGNGRAHLPAILPQGLDVKELTMSAEDSQLLASRQFQVIDIARIFGVPPHMIGENEKSTSWGSGIENMGIAFVIYTLKPHLTRLEQELNRKLFGRNSKYFTEFNVDALMRGDSKAQAEYFTKALGGSSGPGWMTQNEVRRKTNQPPKENGDKLVTWSEKNAQKPA